ncbi:hypothetical protein ACHQM5_025114 [Ranunculus cassubicifolius]
MSLHGATLLPLSRIPFSNPTTKKLRTSSIVSLKIGIEDIAQIAQNKVLIAAAISAAIGQITKPFTTSLIYGENLNLRRIVGSGGFPSSHSAGVVAAATSLGLERGFSDSIFGAIVIFACIVMYDAQAVRWHVGNHAKILNKTILVKTQTNSITNTVNGRLVDSKVVETSLLTNPDNLSPLLPNPEKTNISTLNPVDPLPSIVSVDSDQLEESIGHTRIEVTAGALLGFLVTLAVYNVM